MTGDDEFIGQLEGYLEDFDGVTPLPEHVRHAVHAALPGTRQVRPRPGLLRGITIMSNLSAPLRWGITATAVVVAVALGAALLNVNRNQGVASVAPTASPTPVATPVATPAPSATLLTLRSAPAAACRAGETLTGCMKAGTYALSPDVVAGGASLDVPSGWFEWDPGMGSEGVLVDEPDAPDGSGWGLLFIVPGSVSRDPCDSKAGTYPAGAAVGSVDELVAAMSSWPGFKPTIPQPITIDGASGKVFELTSTKTVATCPTAVLWQTPQLTTLDAYAIVNRKPEQRAVKFRILDLNGNLVVIRTTDFAGISPFEEDQRIPSDRTRHIHDQAALQAMLDSIKWGIHKTP